MAAPAKQAAEAIIRRRSPAAIGSPRSWSNELARNAQTPIPAAMKPRKIAG
ncbi:MAG: hypothetical protein ACRDH9_05685 [Actinomycetota bacterium]